MSDQKDKDCPKISLSRLQVIIAIIASLIAIGVPIIAVANNVYRTSLLENRVSTVEEKLEEHIAIQAENDGKIQGILGEINTNIKWLINNIK